MRASATEYKIWKRESQDPNSKHPGNPGYNEMTKPMDNRSCRE
uniref:Uncharacterized protein n=1 Tax=Trichinella nativa TaxID=6335 RepID=A0A0V1KIX0_9BILA